jgi:hypothetical protein
MAATHELMITATVETLVLWSCAVKAIKKDALITFDLGRL